MRESQFHGWTTADLAGQCRMQAREQLDPELSAFMLATAARLTALAEAKAQARRDVFEEGRKQGLEEAAKYHDDMAAGGRLMRRHTKHAAAIRVLATVPVEVGEAGR